MNRCCNSASKNSSQQKDQALQEILQKYKGKKGALIALLQETQTLYGYLPEEVLPLIAKSQDIALVQVYGVTTFYSQFHVSPRGRHIIRICMGTACHVRGGDKIFAALQEELVIGDGETTEDGRFTLESVACIGACGLAPVITINEDTYGRLKPDQVTAILQQYP
ncbi:NADH-quinone oxidoreductase subunit NuoE [Heliorestis convoluta]|uniref:NADH-quinone oxidoreductase, E subunit n=1 Tax=Heliorestis convoluta TaxID=356322 RepID=A0A5Q2N2P0_9FIRM|nr:NADH-quinone oxidoreductase subunit NuoE [Heliorestis convoluta]QGG49087.1 NADH-quinone oxidoreductase, E subunit [Heliorestis convoluta]